MHDIWYGDCMSEMQRIEDGKLSIVETYEFYDKPLLFSCKNTIGTLYLAVSADETSISETWVYVPISQKRLDQIRAGVIDLHDAFTQAEDDLAYLVITPIDENAQVTIEQIAAQSLSDDMLPLKGERLRLPTASLPPMATKDELSIRASQMLRDQISLYRHGASQIQADEIP